MARIAVVRVQDNVCVTLCIADVNDPPYAGTYFVVVDHIACDIGWVCNPLIGDFINPNPPPDEPVTEIV
jgi:hypothetical protein